MWHCIIHWGNWSGIKGLLILPRSFDAGRTFPSLYSPSNPRISSDSDMFSDMLKLLVLCCMLPAIVYSAPTGPVVRSKSYSGDGTWYQPGLGACGKTNNKNQLIVAVGHGIFDSYPGATKLNPNNRNPICGKQLKATYGEKSVTVTVEDRCAGCPGGADLDFTEAGFGKLAETTAGRIHGVKWEWV
ncbi:RlpA-like double-psi beta-barrel-protein domain-containing protein-containing protein [Mycena epipterygia]|nr:RlpA-like double-psi beta-barrel-protein domain-containing protein-containing protein [Mycena epipterygia]